MVEAVGGGGLSVYQQTKTRNENEIVSSFWLIIKTTNLCEDPSARRCNWRLIDATAVPPLKMYSSAVFFAKTNNLEAQRLYLHKKVEESSKSFDKMPRGEVDEMKSRRVESRGRLRSSGGAGQYRGGGTRPSVRYLCFVCVYRPRISAASV